MLLGKNCSNNLIFSLVFCGCQAMSQIICRVHKELIYNISPVFQYQSEHPEHGCELFAIASICDFIKNYI